MSKDTSLRAQHKRTTPISWAAPMKCHGVIIGGRGAVADYVFTVVSLGVEIRPLVPLTDNTKAQLQSMVRTHYARNVVSRHKRTIANRSDARDE